MADFELAFSRTMGNEGGYANDPDDAGGETYRGISRRFNPDWDGWSVIDAWRDHPSFPEGLASNFALNELTKAFYRRRIWQQFIGDELPDQAVAEELFDTAVNLGMTRAISYLQQALNSLNRNGDLYPDLVVDGSFGRRTLEALQAYLRRDPARYLLTAMNALQGGHYLEYMRKSPTQEKYARGWLDRVVLEKRPA